MDTNTISLLVGIGAVLLVLVALAVFLASRLRTVGPDQALIVVSMGGGRRPGREAKAVTTGVAGKEGSTPSSLFDTSNYSIHTNGRVFIVPVVQDAFTLSLKQRQVELDVRGPDKNFVNVAVTGTLSYKFADDPVDVLRAAQRFHSKPDDEINQSIKEAVEGTLRSIVASMGYREINSDRAAFQEKVLSHLKSELADQGIVVDVLNIRSANAPGTSYEEDLAAEELARASQNAEVARAEANRVSQFAQIQARQDIAARERDLALKESEYLAETDRAAANAAAAGSIAKQEQAKLIAERERAALAAEALTTEERLDIQVKKPADAKAYADAKSAEGAREAAQQRAEADLFTRRTEADSDQYTRKASADAAAYTRKTEADAQAYTRKTEAEANATAERVTAEAAAAATRERGQADAEVERAVGEAKAAATHAQADALSRYGHDALAYEMVQRLPEIMEANAKALGSIGSYTVYGGSPTDAVTMLGSMLGQGMDMLSRTTGVDLSGLVSDAAGSGKDAQPAARAAGAERAQGGNGAGATLPAERDR